MFLTDAKINKSSLNNIKNNIKKHSPYPEKVKIIAVTKTFSNKSIKSAEENKIFYIGENKVQETQKKISNYILNAKTKLCLIGHLQSNKISLAVSLYNIIQSVDSIRLLDKLNVGAKKQNKRQQIFLQLNITNNPSQTGFKEEEIIMAAEHAQKLPFIQISGIMAIGANTKKEKISKQMFKNTRKIQQKIQQTINSQCTELSIGMSGDYVWALQEGSTQLRLGTTLFKKRNEE